LQQEENAMNRFASVESLWRYPVKSMRGEELESTFVGYIGGYGDRIYSFRLSEGDAVTLLD
jgi:uncharacterized protein YcbX